MVSISEQLTGLQKELIELRRDFHMYPELGFEEHRTSGIVASYLKECGLEVSKMAKTGVIGLLRGGQDGKNLLLRADMDALPIQEENEFSYKSRHEGIMHACGHDGHTAMLLVAAKILSGYRDKLKGNIKFVFQPNEEDAGAYLLVEEGVMENPAVDAAAGLHLWSGLESGTVDICAGPVMAASHYFYLTIKGLGGHAGQINKAIDPIMTGSAVIQAVQAMQTREFEPLQPLSIVFTGFKAGFNTTIVPEKAEMQGSIRFLSTAGSSIRDSFSRVIAEVCSAHRADCELKFKVGNEMVSNDQEMAALAREAALSFPENKHTVTAGFRTMGGEDFSEFSNLVPSVFYFLGAGSKDKKTDYSHHHPCFNIDEDVLLTGAEMHVRLALKYFGLL